MNINNAELWLTKSEPVLPDGTKIYDIKDPYYVYILDINKSKSYKGYKSVFIVPVSFEIEFASLLDLIVEKENILNRKFMLQIWNTQSILINNLEKKVFTFDENFHKDVKRLLDYKSDKTTLISDINTGHPSEKSSEIITEYQHKEVKKTEYLRLPAMLLNKLIERENFTENDYVQFVIRVINDDLQYSRCSNIVAEPPLVLSKGCRPVKHLLKPANRFVLGLKRGTYSVNKVLNLIKEVEDYRFSVKFENVDNKVRLSYNITKSEKILKGLIIKIFKDTVKFAELTYDEESSLFYKLLDEGSYKIQFILNDNLISEDYFKVEY